MADITNVGDVSGFDLGESREVTVDGEVVVFNVEEEYCTVKNQCTHQGWELVDGDKRDGVITCSLHRGSFSIETGEVVGSRQRYWFRVLRSSLKRERLRSQTGKLLWRTTEASANSGMF